MAPLVLVTGAAGFLGGHVVRHFAAAGYRVMGRGHGHIAKSASAELGLSDWREDDVTLSTLAGLNATPDVVVHCAGGASISHSVGHPEDDYRRTVGTTREVLDYVRLHAPAARVVLPSSAAVYGEVAHLPIGEETPLAPISPSGHHKKLAEELCRSYAQDYGLRIGIVRLFSVYGPDLRKQLRWDACEKLRKADISRAREWAWRPKVALDEGLAEFVRWYSRSNL